MMLFASVAWGLLATTSPFGKRVGPGHRDDSSPATCPPRRWRSWASTSRSCSSTPSCRSTSRTWWSSPRRGRTSASATPGGGGSIRWQHRPFTLAMVHGILAGTDAVRPWTFWLYVATGACVLFQVMLRGLTVGLGRRARRSLRGPVRGDRPAAPGKPRRRQRPEAARGHAPRSTAAEAGVTPAGLPRRISRSTSSTSTASTNVSRRPWMRTAVSAPAGASAVGGFRR